MGIVTYLRPAMGPDAAERLLAEVEAALGEGRDLGDRRGVLREIIDTLHIDQARLLDVIGGLRAGPSSDHPILAAQITRLDEACSTLHTNISLMLRRADRLIAS